jgi:glycosyltransferase involved in cell wall biosynthesis
MKLLVFAHTPPPVHGQSVMVATLIDGLRDDPELEVLHVDARLSRDAADVGRWRIGKVLALLAACYAAWRLRLRHGPAILYYVPAPGKRGALYRDFLVMLLCRPFFPALVLHWHAVGLGEWIQACASPPERWLARQLLGRANLALVLAPELAADAAVLSPRQVAIVANCAPDPGVRSPRDTPIAERTCNVLFLGTCSREKGLFDAVDAIALVGESLPGGITLTVAGIFPDDATENAFNARIAQLPTGAVRHVGFADEAQKRELLNSADVLCLPSFYPHEGQPVVIIEALAHDLPVITTRWRALPGMLPPKQAYVVGLRQPDQIAAALRALCEAPPPPGAMRVHYLAHFTPARHLADLRTALLSLDA